MNQFFRKLFGYKIAKEQTEISHPGVEAAEPAANITTDRESNVAETEEQKDEPIAEIPPPPPPQEDRTLRNYEYPSLNLPVELQWIFPLMKDSPPAYRIPLLWSSLNESQMIQDFAWLKNLLVVGTQSTGKTTFLHQLILSLLLKRHPSQVKLVLADQKGLDFSIYRPIEKHFLAKLKGEEDPIVRDVKVLIRTLQSITHEMQARFNLLQDAQVKNYFDYNNKFIQRKLDPLKGHQYLPLIVMVIDDLGSYSVQGGTDFFDPLVKIVNEGYKAGIYCILGTSQPTGQFLPGSLLSNITHRITFHLNGREDYRKFLDTIQLDLPLHTGEFFFQLDGYIQKGKTIFFPIEEIESIVNSISSQNGYPTAFLLFNQELHELDGKELSLLDRDSLFEEAARLIVQNQVGSTSLIQRRMKLGYNRTGRLMDQLEAAGIVGHNQGSKARDVLIKTEAELDRHLIALG